MVVFLTFLHWPRVTCFATSCCAFAGTSLERRKITIHVLEGITNQIQRYLLVQVFTSVLVGVATGLAYWALGWKTRPYGVWWRGAQPGAVHWLCAGHRGVGPRGLPAVRLVRHGLAIGGASLVIHTIVGNLLTPGSPAAPAA